MTHSIKCPNCTAPIEFEAGEALAVRCPYCGMSTPIPEALRKKSQARNSVGLSDDAVARIVALIASGNSTDAIAVIQRSTNIDLESARRLHDAMKSGDAAALNMLLHTAAIEVSRRRPLVVVAALQPGTVQSALSQPFVGHDALSPEDAVQRLLSVLDALQPTGRAQFVDHQGQHIPW